MRPTAYIETTIIGYLTARPVADQTVTAHMAFTRSWWPRVARALDLYISELVVAEASAGDRQAAAERLAILDLLPRVAIHPKAREIAIALLREAALPAKADRDALHVGIAATNGIDFLVTWNCRHLANATMRAKIEMVCRDHGFEPPIICTPLELNEVQT